jgi:ATP-dependent 26S proteasome regulatory subunit
MLAKAVAHHTTAAFIRVVGSEFVQKYLGEGPRMVRDIFRLAKENSPAIIFIDEVDAIATKRFDSQTGADREVQRVLLELLNQMDGFDQTTNIKVIFNYLEQIINWKELFTFCFLKLSGNHGNKPCGYFGSGFASSRTFGPKD